MPLARASISYTTKGYKTMMRGIIKTSLSFRYLVIIIAGIIMFLGASQIQEMPVDVLPEFSPPYVEIQTEALGLSAKEVELMITVPMEQDLLAGVAWLDVIRSESVPGLSSILVYFEPGTDLYRARQMVAERLAQSAVGIPHVSKPPTMIQPLSSTSRFMMVGLSSNDLSLIEMSVLARWTIAPRLMGVPGVSTVAIWGLRERQLQVLVDPERLSAYDVSLDQVVETAGNALWVSPLSFLEASSPGTGGFIDTPNQRLSIWHILPISSPEDLAAVPIDGASPLLLGDIAEVVEDHQPLIGDAVINNNSTLLLVIEKLPGINTLDVTHGVESALDALRPGFASIDFNANLYRPATYIDMAISNLSRTLIIAVLLVVLALGAFLYNWRTALISLVTILISLIAALAVLYLRGETLNVMVLAGLVIALGIIIDEVVVDIECLLRRLHQNNGMGTPKRVDQVILESLGESRGTIIFGTLITILAILPIYFVVGNAGAILRSLATTYVLAVVAALVTALTITPALAIILMPKFQPNNRKSPLILLLERGYDRIVAPTVYKPRLVYGFVAVLVVIGLVAIPFIKLDRLLPIFQEPYLLIELEGAPSTSRVEMDRIVSRISTELQSIPGIQDIGAHVGRAIFGDQVVGINSAQLWIYIDPKVDYDATVAAVQQTVDGYSGLYRNVSTYIAHILSQPITSPGDSITVRVYGEDLAVLRRQAEDMQPALAGIKGVASANVDLPVEEPTLEIEVDLMTAQRYGIKPGDVRRAAAIMLSGIQVGSLFEEQKVFDVVVWSSPDIRENLTDIRELPIEIPDGGYIYLGDVANVRLTAAPTVIRREAVSPYLDIHLNMQGRNVSAVIRDVKTMLPTFTFPLEYHAEVLSDYAKQQEEKQHILITIILVLVGIFLLLQASTRNWRLAIAIFLSLPTVLVGGVVAVFLCGGTLSLVSLFGLLSVYGIGVRNTIMLVSRYQNLELQEGEAHSPSLIQHGTRQGLIPILKTMVITGLALLPFVIFGNVAGLEIARPLAIITLGGLVTSTIYNLFVFPALYLKFGLSREADLGFQSVGQSISPEVTGD
jgi:CzcA family heavy metal efflux pump